MNVNNNTDVSMGSFKALSANQPENETVKNETEKSVFEQIDDFAKDAAKIVGTGVFGAAAEKISGAIKEQFGDEKLNGIAKDVANGALFGLPGIVTDIVGDLDSEG